MIHDSSVSKFCVQVRYVHILLWKTIRTLYPSCPLNGFVDLSKKHPKTPQNTQKNSKSTPKYHKKESNLTQTFKLTQK